MPIEYKVGENGHFIHAIATGDVTEEQFIEYESGHLTDARLRSPFKELLEIRDGSFRLVTPRAIEQLVARRGQPGSRHPWHDCAIVVSYSDADAWDLAKLYERLATLHSPCSVIVFGDVGIAKTWLGVSTP